MSAYDADSRSSVHYISEMVPTCSRFKFRVPVLRRTEVLTDERTAISRCDRFKQVLC